MSAVPDLPSSGHPDAAARHWLAWSPPALVLVTLACGLSACFFYTLNHDAAYMLYLGSRILHGEQLYVDLPEINPPLIVWLNLAPAWIAESAGLSATSVLRLAVLLLGLLAVAWSSKILQGALTRGAWWSWLSAAIFGALVMPGYDFGQREHFALLCILPYLSEAALRVNGSVTTRANQAAVAALATVGLALKPHFLLAPLLVEAYAFWRLRRLGLGCRVAAGLLVAYAAVVVWFAPAYFDMLRMLAGGYWKYSKGWLGFLDMAPFHATWLLVALALVARPRDSRLPQVLALAILGFALAAIVQQKGGVYHWVPALALAWLLFGQAAAAATAHRRLRGMALTPLIVTAIVALLSLFSLSVAVKDGHKVNPYPDMLSPVIRELGGGPVIIFSAFRTSFPLVTEPGIGSSTRFPTMTIVQAMERGGNKEAVEWIHRSFAKDFYARPPRLLLVETDAQGRPLIDFVRYFSRDVPELQQYRLVRRLPEFQILAAPIVQDR